MTTPGKPDPAVAKPSSSAYATGGGGTILEHRYAAIVLASLLLEAPIPGLGDDFAVETVRFQAAPDCALDDLLVTGVSRRSGIVTSRRLAVGIRRDPTIAASDTKFVKLLGDCLLTVQRYGSEFDADTFRLAIVVVAPHSGAQELSELAQHARSFGSALDFEHSVGTPGRLRRQLNDRFQWFREALQLAQSTLSLSPPLDTAELAWRLLRSLWIEQCHLEEVSTDRTHCVRQLQALLSNPAEADTLFDHLCVLAGEHAKAGGTVSGASLRRLLAGKFQLDRAKSLTTAWQMLDLLADSMRSRTQNRLEPRAGTSGSVHIDRAKARSELAEAVRQAAAGGVLLVTGEPGVGKSALALDVVTELSRQGQAALTMLSMRDLGNKTAIELAHMLDSSLADVFGATAVAALRLLLLDGAEVVHEGMDRVFGDVVRAACAAGLMVIAVTRQDAEDNVASILSTSANKAPDSIKRHAVEGLSEEEADALVARLPQLKHLAEHPGSRWLLRRPGLLKLVLADDVLHDLPDGPLCEAVVHLVIWRKLVRRAERLDADHATADGRAATILSLARRLLLPGSTGGISYPDPYALPSLRSDGVLLPVPKGFVWRAGEEFASDLLRDIAVTQQLLQEPQLLVDAKAPRWTLHATRVFLQALLMQGGRDPLHKLAEQIAFCQALAQQHGARWADLPWEALLTASDPGALLEAQWAFLQENDGKELHDLLRVLISRFGESGQISADIGESVVRLLCDHYQDVVSLRGDLSKPIEKCLRGWLRSLAARKNQDTPDLLRARIRDLFLFNHQYQRDEWCVECLGLFGPDLNEE